MALLVIYTYNVYLNWKYTSLDAYFLITCLLLILLAGDVHTNPGLENLLRDIRLCHSNIRSLNQDKLRHIRADIANDFDIIALSETFLNYSTPSDNLVVPVFHDITRRDRSLGRPGGGVALYCSQSVTLTRRNDLEVSEIEILWAEIRIHNNKLLLGVVYRPPNATSSIWEHF